MFIFKKSLILKCLPLINREIQISCLYQKMIIHSMRNLTKTIISSAALHWTVGHLYGNLNKRKEMTFILDQPCPSRTIDKLQKAWEKMEENWSKLNAADNLELFLQETRWVTVLNLPDCLSIRPSSNGLYSYLLKMPPLLLTALMLIFHHNFL